VRVTCHRFLSFFSLWRLWGPIAKQLKSSDALVVVAPEWSGMVPPGLKNFFLLCGADVLAHKPGLIVTVSAGLGGSYPVNSLWHVAQKKKRAGIGSGP